MTLPASWRGWGAGKRCFVIGNGPSLNQQDLGLLKDEFTIGCNLICRRIPVDFLCLSDNRVWAKHMGEIKEQWLAPQPKYKHLVLSAPPCPRPPGWAVTIPMDSSKRVWDGHFQENLPYTCWHRTVIMDLCLPLAVHMRFDKIYLIGCDSTHVGHFYDPGVEFPKHERAPFDQLDRGWDTFRQMVNNRGRKIFNATTGGRDIPIPRVRYEELFR